MIVRIVLRNLLRHKLRVTLGFTNVVLAALLFHLFLGATTALDDFFNGSLMRSTLFVKPRDGAMWVSAMPSSYGDEIAKLPGVLAVTPLMSTGTVTADNPDLVAVIGIDPGPFRVIAEKDIAELSPEVYAKFADDPNGALVSRGVRITHHFRADTRVDLPLVTNNIDPKLNPGWVPPPTQPVIRANFVAEISRGVFSDRVLIVHRDALERAINWKRAYGILVRYQPGTDPGELAGRIDKTFETRGTEAVEALLLENWFGAVETFVKEISGIVLTFIGLVGLLAGVIILHGVISTADERLPEIGTLRAFGTNRWQVFAILAGEGIIVCVGGAVLATLIVGVLTSTTTIVDLKKIDPSIAPTFKLRLDNTSWVIGAALAVAALGACIPAFVFTQARIADLVRRRE